MWDPDNFPGADNVPWQLLIRARYVHELDAVLASMIFRQIDRVATMDATGHVAKASHVAIVGHGAETATPEQRLAAFDAALDWDDWCGTPWPRPWPGPRRGYERIADPIAGAVFAHAADLVQRAGSEELQKSLGTVLVDGVALRG